MLRGSALASDGSDSGGGCWLGQGRVDFRRWYRVKQRTRRLVKSLIKTINRIEYIYKWTYINLYLHHPWWHSTCSSELHDVRGLLFFFSGRVVVDPSLRWILVNYRLHGVELAAVRSVTWSWSILRCKPVCSSQPGDTVDPHWYKYRPFLC